MYLRGIGVPADPAKGLGLLTLAAKQRDPAALRLLGVAYAEGAGVPADPAAAEKYLRRAAEGGDAEAQLILGGAGAVKVRTTAEEEAGWLAAAADRGVLAAAQRLGECYEQGRGVTKDDEQALAAYLVAAARRQAADPHL